MRVTADRMTVTASPSRVNVVFGRGHGDTLDVVVLETPGGRWELPHTTTTPDEDPREAVTRALTNACERVPEGVSIARAFHVDARIPDDTGIERYLPVFSSLDEVSVVPDGSAYTNVAWVTLDEARARLDPERRAALDELAREEPYLRLCAFWARATRKAVPLREPATDLDASRAGLAQMESKARDSFARVLGTDAVASRFAIPELYLRFLALAGTTWRWGDEYGLYLEGGVMDVAGDVEYYAKIYGKGLPTTAAMWIPAGQWSDKHHYRLCCDRSSPHFGTLADFHDDHPWNIGADLDDDFEEDEAETDDELDDNETERRLGREGDPFWECSPERPTILEFVAHLAGDSDHTRDPFDD